MSPKSVKAAIKTMRGKGVRARAGSHDSSAMRFGVVWHKHDVHQLLYAFEGSVHIESEDARFLVPPQLAAFIPAGVVHRTRIEGRRSGSVFLPRASLAPGQSRIRILRASPLMREMIAEAMRWPLDGSEYPAGRVYFRAFAMLCREWIESEAPFHLPTTDDPCLGKAMEFTQSHLATVRCSDVCRAAGLSERSLRRRFVELAGMGWGEYRHRSRLLKAATLLENPCRPVTEIAARVGFQSVSAFSRAFRALTGETPRAYRDRIRLR